LYPALPVALVDRDRMLWVEGFGHIDRGGTAPVNADTIFSVLSMSKLLTATVVMQAVAAGRLDLDAPITTYTPSSPPTARSRYTRARGYQISHNRVAVTVLRHWLA
jgi:CubicO group peptidase (beta-lactamase class C family)